MHCDAIREKLEAFVDGELDEDVARAVKEHIDACAACRDALQDLERIAQLLLSEPIEPLPASVTGSIADASCPVLRAFQEGGEARHVDARRVLADSLEAVAEGGVEAEEGRGRRTLGPYEVHETIGTGSMGRVYRGLDRNLDRRVAIKEIHPQLVKSETAVRRFIREARLVARLHHQNVCLVYFLDVAADTGLPFIAMEYVEGSTLDGYVEANKPLPVSEAAAIVRQVAVALQAAHEGGIIHRDVKPANILVTAEGLVKVSDFGLAKALGKAPPLTLQGSIIGTPHFMSPEAARGKEADHRSDIYSLGLTFFFTLAGRLPYATTNVARVLEAKQFGPVPDVTEYRPETPRPLAAVIERMLAKAPEDRYPNYMELIAALDDAAP